MKKIFILLFILLNIQNALAKDDLLRFPVNDMASTNFDVMFELLSDEKFGRIVLDCQSFIHGIKFYNPITDGKDETVLFNFYLESDECSHIFDYIEQSLYLGKHVCIELNSFSGRYRLSRDYKDCN